MTTEEELLQFEEDYRKVRTVISIRSALVNCYTVCTDLKMRVDSFSGEDFDLIPADIKAAFIRMYQIFNQARIACEADPDFQYIINKEKLS